MLEDYGIAGFRSVQDVTTIQSFLLKMLGIEKQNRTIVDEIKGSEIARLMELKGRLLTEERELFKVIGDPELLKQRLEEWNRTNYESYFITGSGDNFVNMYYDVIYTYIQNEWFNKNYKNKISDFNSSEKFTEMIAKDVQEGDTRAQIKQTVLNILQEGTKIQGKQNSGLQDESIDKLKKHLEVVITAKDGNIKKGDAKFTAGDLISIKFTNAKNMTPYMQEQIGMIFTRIGDQELESLDFNDPKLLREIVRRMLKTMGINSDGSGGYNTPESALASELYQGFIKNNSFAINRSIPMVIGFLGEVYWNAFWKYLLQGSGTNVIAVGKQEATSGATIGKQIPIDMVIKGIGKGIGFQIKNYKIKGGKKRKYIRMPPSGPRKIELKGFLTNHIELPYLVDDIAAFLFSAGYNKPANEYRNGSYRDADWYEDVIYAKFKDILKVFDDELKEIAEARMDKILGVDKSFTSNIDDLFQTDDMVGGQYNVIYLIGNNIVLGSDIIQATIDSLAAADESQMLITFKIFNTDGITIPNVGVEWPNEGTYEPDKALSKQKIEYQVEINITNIMQNIDKFIESL